MSQAGFKYSAGTAGSGPEMYIEDLSGASVAVGLNASSSFIISRDSSPTSTGVPGQFQIDTNDNVSFIPADSVSVTQGHLNVNGIGGYLVLPVSQPGVPDQGFISFDGAGNEVAIHFAGTSNSFFGEAAGNFDSISGSTNTGVGTNALEAITSGNGNCAVGTDSLKSLTTGISNVAVGTGALASVIASEGNIALGTSAGGSVASGNYNVIIGNSALSAATAIAETIAIGAASLQNLTTGAGNVAVGHQTMQACTTSGSNTSVGYQSLKAQTVSAGSNTSVGYQSLLASVNGDGSTAVGASCLSRENGPGENTCVGTNCGKAIVTGGLNAAVGYNCMDSGADSGTGNVVVGAGSFRSGLGDFNTILGSLSANDYTSNESNNIIIGHLMSVVALENWKIRIGRELSDGCAITGISLAGGGATLLGADYQPVMISADGGMGTLADADDGQILIGNTGGSPLWATITPGSNISITNGPNSISIAAATGSTTATATTVDAETAILINVGVGEDEMITITAVINGFITSSDQCYGGTVTMTAFRAPAGNITLAGAPIFAENNTSTVVVSGVVDVGTQAAHITVTGILGETWNWKASYQVLSST